MATFGLIEVKCLDLRSSRRLIQVNGKAAHKGETSFDRRSRTMPLLISNIPGGLARNAAEAPAV
jgi:hypothetical protein